MAVIALRCAPNPSRAEQPHDPSAAAAMRRLDCVYYDQCLDVAVREDWPGFHCQACQAYESPSAERA